MTNKKDLSVVILCGGKGERLKPLTDNTPKPLIKIKQKPIISYLINHLKRYGFKEYIVTVGYKANVIKQYFRENHQDLNVRIVDSGDANIVKRIRDASEGLQNDFIVCYGDTLADVDLDRLVRYHRKHDSRVTVTLYPLQSQFGIMELDKNGLVTSFREKPMLEKWINIGYFYFDKCMHEETQRFETFVEFLHQITNSGQLNGFQHRGIHITVNTFQELVDAEQNIEKFVNSKGDK